MSNLTTIKATLYYANWCGHCKPLKPIWFHIKKIYKEFMDPIAEKYKIALCIENYEADTDKAYIDKVTIGNKPLRGFPTITIERNGKTDVYTGERSLQGILSKLIDGVDKADVDVWVKKCSPPSDTEYIQESVSRESASSDDQSGAGLNTEPELKGINLEKAKIIFANSYHKYLKYKNKCNQ